MDIARRYASTAACVFLSSMYSWPNSVHADTKSGFSRSARLKYTTARSCSPRRL